MDGGGHGKRVAICFVFILLWVQTGDQVLLFVSPCRHGGRLKSCSFSLVSEVRLNSDCRTDSHSSLFSSNPIRSLF